MKGNKAARPYTILIDTHSIMIWGLIKVTEMRNEIYDSGEI